MDIKIGYLLRQDMLNVLDEQKLTELTGGKMPIGQQPKVDGSDTILAKAMYPAFELTRGYSHYYDIDTEFRSFFEYDEQSTFTVGSRITTPLIIGYSTDRAFREGEWVQAMISTVAYESKHYQLYKCIQTAPIGTPITDTAFFELLTTTLLDQERSRMLFLCIQDAPAGTPLLDTDYFSEKDDRNATVVRLVAVLTSYYLHSTKNAQHVPDQVNLEYERAETMLKDIQKGRINLSIARREEIKKDSALQRIAYGSFDQSQDY